MPRLVPASVAELDAGIVEREFSGLRERRSLPTNVAHRKLLKHELIRLPQILKTDLGSGFEFVGPAQTNSKWFGRGEGIAVRKGNAELLTRLNQALRQILADGTYAEIRAQYFDYDIYGDQASVADSPAMAAQSRDSDARELHGR